MPSFGGNLRQIAQEPDNESVCENIYDDVTALAGQLQETREEEMSKKGDAAIGVDVEEACEDPSGVKFPPKPANESSRKQRRRLLVVLVLLGVVIAAGVGLGLGLGLNSGGDSTNEGDSGSGGSNDNTATSTTAATTTALPPSPPTPSFTDPALTTVDPTTISGTVETSVEVSLETGIPIESPTTTPVLDITEEPLDTGTPIESHTATTTPFVEATTTPMTTTSFVPEFPSELPSETPTTPPIANKAFYCSGNGAISPTTGRCECHTAEWTGTYCHIHRPVLNLERGTQPIMWAFPFCMASPDMDYRKVQKVSSWVCSKILTKYPNEPHRNCHDTHERTGIFSLYDAHAKSALTFTYWANEMNMPCQDLRGYFTEDGEFEYDINGNQIAVKQLHTGPAIFPTQEVRPVPTEFCGPNEMCCLPRLRGPESQDHYYDSVARMSITLQRLCSPVYKLECDPSKGDIECQSGGYGANSAECNCLRVDHVGLLQYTGYGADCRRITPGGDLTFRDGMDLFQRIAFAAQDIYRKTGQCEFLWNPNESDLVLCQNNEAGDGCLVQYQPGIHTDWTDWFNGGKP
eukprot:Nk52_evm25s255 gene=Nk52_evmTU25s255